MLVRNRLDWTLLGATAVIILVLSNGAARNGVITPPAPGADAAINREAPSATTGTPVIPPPGSPGGNPTIVPK